MTNWRAEPPMTATDVSQRQLLEIAAKLHIATLERQLTEAREVIKPFAKAADFFEQTHLDGDMVAEHERQGEGMRINVGHLRCAREWLKAHGGEK